MNEQEGVIKYRLDYHYAEARTDPGFTELNAWRSLLWRLGMIGQDDARYDGLGYGNLSLRLEAGGFLITGTQTGHLSHLTADHYCYVREARPKENYLRAEGPLPPSSEALTHAAIFGAVRQVRCVVHGHSPEVWRNAAAMELQCVEKEIAYGSTMMAAAVGTIAGRYPTGGIIAMMGHQDGIISYGTNPERACWLMARCLAQAFCLSHPNASVESR